MKLLRLDIFKSFQEVDCSLPLGIMSQAIDNDCRIRSQNVLHSDENIPIKNNLGFIRSFSFDKYIYNICLVYSPL